MLRATPSQTNKEAIKKDIREIVDSIGLSASLLPGSPDEKRQVLTLISQLMETSSTRTSADISEALAGDWDLVFTSNGTVVTRTSIVQAIALASNLPGTGIRRIHQMLKEDRGGSLKVLNEAVLGMGPLGEWRFGIRGEWVPISNDLQGNQISHTVKFEGLAAGLKRWLGFDVPDVIPEISVSIPDHARGGGVAWLTSYCDEDMRIGRGSSSGNIFLFFKASE